jgi:hypothetical protein
VLGNPNGKGLGPSYKEVGWDSKQDAESEFESKSVIYEIRVGLDIVSREILLVSRFAVVAEIAWASWCSEFFRRRPWSLPSSSTSQIQDPKMKVDPIRKNVLSRSVEVLSANPLKAPTWRTSCRCFTIDSLPWGVFGIVVRTLAYAELDG